MADEKSVEQRLVEARERKATREKAAEEAEKLRELEILELEERFEKELGGRVGETFTVIDAGPAGVIVAKVGEAVLYKQFHASIAKNKQKNGGDGITPEACQIFVTPLVVYPDRTRFGEMVEKHQGILFRLANAVESLYQAKKADEDSKR